MSIAKKRIKKPKINSKINISSQEVNINYDEKPPVFSLERLQAGNFCLESLDKDGKAFFADAIFKRKDKTWKEIKQMPRHGLGFEKICRSAINAPIPLFITPDVDHFLAFRFYGKKPMVGYRQNNIFYVLWFDGSYQLYNHS